MGFEPMHRGFADPCLTTWLRRRAAISLAQDVCSGKRNPFASHYDGTSGRLVSFLDTFLSPEIVWHVNNHALKAEMPPVIQQSRFDQPGRLVMQ